MTCPRHTTPSGFERPQTRPWRGSFAVRPEGNGATVALEWEFEALEPTQETELAGMVDAAAKQTLEMLRVLVEGRKQDEGGNSR